MTSGFSISDAFLSASSEDDSLEARVVAELEVSLQDLVLEARADSLPPQGGAQGDAAAVNADDAVPGLGALGRGRSHKVNLAKVLEDILNMC